MELLIGSGSRRTKQLYLPEHQNWKNLITLDMNADHKPDFVHDLLDLPLPFPDNHFDEIHAYDVLEHLGQQGDYRWFFRQFEDFWRLLVPGGMFHAISPDSSSRWAWADPGHTRCLPPECLVFLSQQEYKDQVGRTPMTDYRFCYAADFDTVHSNIGPEGAHGFVLQAVKPSRRDHA